jgi:hypothetical protein
VLPLVYCAAALLAAPRDRLGAPPALNRTFASGFSTSRVLYDDYDVTAMALRGLNTAVRRVPSSRDTTKCLGERFTAAAGEPRTLGRVFFAEYPHAALWLFRLALPSKATIRGWGVTSAVLDACYPDLVTYAPTQPNDRYLWRRLRLATDVYRTGGTVCLLALIVVLRRGFPDRRIQAVALLTLPAALYFAVNRFDVVPALLTAVSLIFLARDRLGASGIALGLATAVKVYPILLAPFVLRYLWRAPRRMAHWAAGFICTLAAIVGLAWVLYGTEGLMAPYAYQLQRPAELDWIYYGHILPYSWAMDPFRSTVFRIGTLSLTLVVLLLPPLREMDQLLRRGAIVLITFTSLQVFWSPQWLLWLHPLLLPLVSGQPIVGWLMAALDLTMFASFPLVYDAPALPIRDQWIHSLVWLRAVWSALLVAALAHRELQTGYGKWIAWRPAPQRS